MDSNCLFCKMAGGSFEVDKVYEDDLVFAIKDINPRVPTHALLIPKEHIASARELEEGHGPLLGRLFGVAASLAKELGVAEDGYRLTFNVGEHGGQTMYHLHLHLLGGRQLGPEG